jgi:hypothetical protein
METAVASPSGSESGLEPADHTQAGGPAQQLCVGIHGYPYIGLISEGLVHLSADYYYSLMVQYGHLSSADIISDLVSGQQRPVRASTRAARCTTANTPTTQSMPTAHHLALSANYSRRHPPNEGASLRDSAWEARAIHSSMRALDSAHHGKKLGCERRSQDGVAVDLTRRA